MELGLIEFEYRMKARQSVHNGNYAIVPRYLDSAFWVTHPCPCNQAESDEFSCRIPM